ncbi:hypothetical protein K502DRAFT_368759 [Neoconidiobolus thromboides FSU 785]|nr:hypothetical protein K502DRAFT_368759 [Neoconidiobolus thromboides FSU 785]
MKISWEESDKSKIKTTIETMLKNQSLDSLTEKKLRRGIEKELSFPELSLDEENIKLFIKETINQFILENENSNDKDDNDNYKEDEEENEDKKEEQDGKFIVFIYSDQLTKVEEMDLSELEEEGVKEKKTKSKKSVNNKKKEEKVVKGKPKEKESGIETRLNNLKGYVVKCGVRKQWKKIFEGLTIQQQVKKVESILKELGMEGRPSNEKAKKIAMKRELQMEKESLDTSNIINTDNLPGRKSRRKRNYFEFEESDENEVEGDNKEEDEDDGNENENGNENGNENENENGNENENDEKEENGNNEDYNEKEEMENKRVKKDNNDDENKQNNKQNNANVNNEQETTITIIGEDDPLAKMIFSSPIPQNE